MMKIASNTYVPSLRWRMGEYQALSRLSEDAKARIVPFIVVPEIEYDFEKLVMKHTLQEHVELFPERYKKKWGARPAWIDVHSKIQTQKMDNGKFPIAWVFDELDIKNAAVPITSLDATPEINAAVAAIVKHNKRGVGIRTRIEHVMKPTCKAVLEALMKSVGAAPKEVDLIIDLGAPNYEPYADFADALIAALSGLGDVSAFRSYVLLGCAYPESVALGKPGGDLPRHDWLFYEVFVSKLPKGARVPNFGDYAVVNPNFTPRDMRKVKSAGKVVYTHQNNWYVRKGGAFNDNRAQMHDHCAYIVSPGKFRGVAFSDGDAFIDKCATKAVGPSSPTRWKEVAISHHIMHVLEDLAKYGAVA
jgi:hypothetical protein